MVFFVKIFVGILKVLIHLSLHGDEYQDLIDALEKQYGIE